LNVNFCNTIKPTHLFDNELTYFQQLFGDKLLQKICHETNLYASQERLVQRKGKKVKITTNNWSQLTLEELKAFRGILPS
jgi:hypothetical protein